MCSGCGAAFVEKIAVGCYYSYQVTRRYKKKDAAERKNGGMAMDVVQFCEAAMMIAFGCSWPLNIVKSLQSRTAKGKSVQFEIIVVLGYMVGLVGKIVSWQRTGVLAYSVWFYILNMVMVSIDIVLYFRNSALDRAREQNATS